MRNRICDYHKICDEIKNLDEKIQFGNVENKYDFMYGYFMGEQGIAFATANCKLGREMNNEERENIAKIIKSKAITVEDIIKSIKNSNH